MADPLEGVLDDIDPQTPPTTDPNPNVATIDKDELERLRNAAERVDHLEGTLAQLQQRNPDLPTNDDDAEFWQNPKGSAAKIARDVMAPAARQMSAKLGALAISNFKATKVSDPFYAVAAPIFDAKLANIPKEALGSMDDAILHTTLAEAWNAAVGEWTQKRRAQLPPKDPPANLGGGSGTGGGPKQKRSLEEIDRVAFLTAKRAGLSDEEIQSIADDIEGAE